MDITADDDIGGHVSDTTNGYDIRFTKTDGTTLLKYEREYFNVTTGTATGHFWISGDGWVLANASGTDLYVYYNDGDGTVDGEDAANVWDANFKAVWHLKESGNGSGNEFVDSTSNANHGTGGGVFGSGDSGKTPSQVNGKIYKGQSFDGGDDIIGVVNSDELEGMTGLTLEGWIYWTEGSDNYERIIDFSYGNCYGLYIVDSTNYLGMFINTTGAGGSAVDTATDFAKAVTPNSWQYFNMIWSAAETEVNIAIDNSWAEAKVHDGDNIGTTTDPMYLGDRADSGRSYEGYLDEIRISSIRRADAWLKFTYYNINEDDNELDWASEESVVAPSFIPQIIMIT